MKANLYRNASAKIIEKFLTERRAGKAIIDVMQMPPPRGGTAESGLYVTYVPESLGSPKRDYAASRRDNRK